MNYLTADDMAALQMMRGGTFGPHASCTLPSGRTLTGVEMTELLASLPPLSPMEIAAADQREAEAWDRHRQMAMIFDPPDGLHRQPVDSGRVFSDEERKAYMMNAAQQALADMRAREMKRQDERLADRERLPYNGDLFYGAMVGALIGLVIFLILSIFMIARI